MIANMAFTQVNGAPEPCTSGSENTCQCENSPVLCTINDLDGYSYSMTTFLHPNDGPDPMCTGSEGNMTESHNPTWFAFLAWCEDLTFKVNFSNCTNEGSLFFPCQGIQAAVYEDCSLNPSSAIACDTDTGGCDNNGNRIVDVTGMSIGSTYYFLVDGCCGSACDIIIEVIGDCGVQSIGPWEQEIQGPDVVCPSEVGDYYLEFEHPGAFYYTWYLDGIEIDNGQGLLNTSVNFPGPGTYEVCVDVDNDPCILITEDPEPLCKTITVIKAEAEAGDLLYFPTFPCPGEPVNLETEDYTDHPLFDHWVIITDLDGWITEAINGPDGIFTLDSCGTIEAYVYNFYNQGDFTIPEIGDNIFDFEDCENDCYCDLVPIQIDWTDFTPPLFLEERMDTVLTCYTQLAELDSLLEWSDDCQGSGFVLGIDTDTLASCSGGTTTRVWTYADGCGNMISVSQMITIESSITFEWLDTLPSPILEVQCGDTIPDLDSLRFTNNATDELCLLIGGIPGMEVGSLEQCGDTLFRSWILPEPVCDSIIEYHQLIILADTIAPIFPNPPQDTLVLACIQDLPPLENLTWEDNCDGMGETEPLQIDNYDPCLGGEMIRSWTYTDSCGSLSISVEQVIVIEPPLMVACDDGDPCTTNDVEVVNCDGTICEPCQGEIFEVDLPEVAGNLTICEQDSTELVVDNCLGTTIWLDGTNTTLYEGDTLQSGSLTSDLLLWVFCLDQNCPSDTVSIPITVNTLPVPSIVGDAVICVGESTELTVSSPFDQYLWNTGEEGNEIIATTADIYSVTVTDSFGCTNSTSFDLQVITDLPQVEILGSQSFCIGGSTQLTAETTESVIEWSTAETMQTITVASEGLISVTVTDSDGCTGSSQLMITEQTFLEPSIGGDTQFCPGTSTILDAGVFNSWLWNTGSIEQTLEVDEAGVFTVTVSDLSGCTGTSQVTVSEYTPPTPEMQGLTDICLGDSTELSLLLNYEDYIWNTSDTTAVLQASQANQYSVTVSDSNGCTGATSQSIAYLPAPLIDNTVPTCDIENGEYQMDITTSASDLISEYPTNMNQAGVFSISSVPLDSILSVTLINSETGCDTTILINPPTCDCTAVADAGPDQIINCATTAVTLGGDQTSQGTAFDYAWLDSDGNILSEDPSFDAEIEGTYLLQVIDLINNCTIEDEVEVLDQTNQPVAVILASPTDAFDCTIQSIELSAQVEQDVAYSWQFNKLTEEGNTFLVESAGEAFLYAIDTITGCGDTTSLIIQDLSEYPFITINEPAILTCTNNTIMLDASPSQSGSTIEYQWSDVNGEVLSTDAVVSDITQPGLYVFESTDTANDCLNSDTIEVIQLEQYPEITLDESLLLACDLSNNTITVEVLSGELVQATWSELNTTTNLSDTEVLQITDSGQFVVEVQDILTGCITSDTIIVDLATGPETLEVDPINPNCITQASGEITLLEISGGNPPFNYSIGGETNTTGEFSSLEADTYTYLVTDSLGCTFETQVILEDPEPVDLTASPAIQSVTFGSSASVELITDIDNNVITQITWDPPLEDPCPLCLVVEFENVTSPQEYIVEIENIYGCTDTTLVALLVTQQEDIFVPNIFNPLDENETFYPQSGTEGVIVNTMQVYDRWGNIVFMATDFETNDPTAGWNGTFNGAQAESGVYVYVFEFDFPGLGLIVKSGDITLVY